MPPMDMRAFLSRIVVTLSSRRAAKALSLFHAHLASIGTPSLSKYSVSVTGSSVKQMCAAQGVTPITGILASCFATLYGFTGTSIL